MKITVSHTEYRFNRATREREGYEVTDGFYYVPPEVATALKELAPKYRVSVADMIGLVVSYYFGDGKDHFGCEYCDWLIDEDCDYPELGEQTTIPT